MTTCLSPFWQSEIMFDFFQMSGKVPVLRQFRWIIDKGLIIDWPHIFIIPIEISSQPWVLLTCSAIIIFNISWSLNWKEESFTVDAFETKWGKVLPLFSGVHFDAKTHWNYLVFFQSHFPTYHLLVREELEQSFCH